MSADETEKFYRIPPQDITMGDPSQFGQRWEARVPLPLKDCGDFGRALHARFADFRAGDLVNVCAFDSRSFTRVTEIASFRIVAKDFETLTVLQIGETATVPEAKKARPRAAGEPLEIVTANGQFEVRDAQGNTIEMFVERRQAEEFARTMGGVAERPGKPRKAA